MLYYTNQESANACGRIGARQLRDFGPREKAWSSRQSPSSLLRLSLISLLPAKVIPNLPTKTIPTKIAWLGTSGKVPTDTGIPPLEIEIIPGQMPGSHAPLAE